MLAGSVSSAWGQAVPKTGAEAAPPPAAQHQDDIVVVADPSQRSSIDRTTYAVRDTAEARSQNVLDLLERIPSVDVTASGQVRLLGRGGVRILIDGNEVANPQAVLRNLQGSQIAKIEVISNPSAQFSAQGTGGIINIVLRRSFAAGVAGSLAATAGSFGTYNLKASPSWSHNRLSLSGSVGASRGVSPTDFETRRSAIAGSTVTPETLEQGRRRNTAQNYTGSLTATYRPSSSQSMSLAANVVRVDGVLASHSDFTDFSGAGDHLTQTASGTLGLDARDIGFDYRRSFAKAGETLSFSAKQSESEVLSANRYSTLSALAGPRVLDLRSNSATGITSVRLDYNLPLGPKRRLALGGAIQHQRDRLVSLTAGTSPLGSVPFTESSTIAGSWTQGAAYLTYQFPLEGAVVLAGLRVEDRGYQSNAPGAGKPLHGTHVFPSLHAERPVASWLTADLSYSRRIEWPTIVELDPALRFTDSTTVRSGDPALRPQLTDSFEGKLEAKFSGYDLALTAFSRRTGGYQTSVATLGGDGTLLLRPVNVGALTSRGLSVDARGPIARGFSFMLGGNLSGERIDDAPGAVAGAVRSSTRYDVNATLEYRDGAEGKRNADHVELRARYNGPFDTGLVGVSSFATVNAVWSHAITDRVSSVLTLTDVIGPPTIRTRYFTDTILARQFERAAGPRATLSMTITLGPSRH